MGININVLFFASLRERFKKNECTLLIPDGTKVSDIFKYICPEVDEAQKLSRYVRVAINKEYAALDDQFNDGDEVALIPPVAGG